MSQRETEHLRVLIANERKDRLELLVPIVAALGHEVIAREIDVEDVGAVTARERPDVALVGLGESSQHALQMVEKIVHEPRQIGSAHLPTIIDRLQNQATIVILGVLAGSFFQQVVHALATKYIYLVQ